jgi:hypothetical protein
MLGFVPWSVMLATLLANKHSFRLGEGGHDHSSKRSRLYSPLSALGREAFLLVCAALFSVACVAVSRVSRGVLASWIQGHQARMVAGVGLLTASSICSSIFAITRLRGSQVWQAQKAARLLRSAVDLDVDLHWSALHGETGAARFIVQLRIGRPHIYKCSCG